MVDRNGEVINNMKAEDADRIRRRIINILNDRRLYGDILTMYKDSEEFMEAVHKQVYELKDGETAQGFEAEGDGPLANVNIAKGYKISDDPAEMQGYTNPVADADKIRIREVHGTKIINPLLAICDKGDFTFAVARELIPNSFDKDEIEPFLDKLEEENKTPYEGTSSCRSACTGLCVGTCGNVCDGCSTECSNICTGCGACTGTCSHLCGHGACTGICTGECMDSCGGQCTGKCFGSCNGGCGGSCYAACGGACNSGCSHTCKGSNGGGNSTNYSSNVQYRR